jgi:hypothetical protein
MTNRGKDLGRLCAVMIFILACDAASSQEPGTALSREGIDAARERAAGEFTSTFRIEDCTFLTEGSSPFFPLIEGQVLTLAGEVDGVLEELVITTTDQTITIGSVVTRIVEERHTEDGELVEVSRNFFAHCAENNSVFYFGEDVDNYEDGEIVNHNGSWQAGQGGATAGVIMPGLPLLGARYFQEVAPGIALDRAEVFRVNGDAQTPFQHFTGVLVTKETTPLEPGVVELKKYAPGIGIIADADLRLTGVTTP